MKKFLISTFLSATCLSFCADVKGMEQPAEQQNQPAVLSRQDSLKADDINTLINLLSEAGEKYENIIKNLRTYNMFIDRGNTGPLYPNHPLNIFCYVIAQGDLDMASKLIAQGYAGYGPINVNQADQHDVIPLMYAAQSGSEEILEFLRKYRAGFTENGNRIAQVDRNGNTLLHYAIQGGAQVVKWLSTNRYITDKDLNSPCNEAGEVPLFVACRDGNVELVKFLLDFVKDFDNINDHIQAFKYAIHSEYATEIIPLLLELFKKSNMPTLNTQDLINQAMLNDDAETVNLLLMHPKIDLSTSQNVNLLCWAARYNHMEIVKFLLDKCPEIDVNDASPGESSLGMAIVFGRTAVVELMLQHENVDTKNKEAVSKYLTEHKYLKHVQEKAISLLFPAN